MITDDNKYDITEYNKRQRHRLLFPIATVELLCEFSLRWAFDDIVWNFDRFTHKWTCPVLNFAFSHDAENNSSNSVYSARYVEDNLPLLLSRLLTENW